MRDIDHFEAGLQARLDAYAARAARSVDARATARAAIAAGRSGGGSRSSGEPHRLVHPAGWAPRWLPLDLARAVGVGLLSMALIVTGVLIVGTPPLNPGPSPTFVVPTPPPGPIGGTFEMAGSLNTARSGHTAVLLHDGRVLVIGGWSDQLAPAPVVSVFDRRGAPPASEIYDPRSGTVTSFDPIVPAFNRGNEAIFENQAEFSATVLADGRVLVAGGRLGLDPDGMGGVLPPPPSASAVLFDPATGRTTQTGSMTVARAGHVAALLPDGRVLIAGGIGSTVEGGEASLSSAEIYDSSTGLFSPTGPMASDRAFASLDLAATVLSSGRILISGGGQWQVDKDGLGGGGGEVPDELYDPASGAFDKVPSERWPETEAVLLLRGDDVIRYELATGVRTDITPRPADLVRQFGIRCRDLPSDCRSGMSTTRLADGRILLAGGRMIVVNPFGGSPAWSSVAQTWAEILDPESLVVVPTGTLGAPRTGHTATLLPDGRVLLIGGYEPLSVQDPKFLSSVEVFNLDP